MTMSRMFVLLAAMLPISGCMSDPLAGLSRDPNFRVQLFGDLAEAPGKPLTLPPDAPRLLASVYDRDVAGEVVQVASRGDTTEWQATDGAVVRLDAGILTGTTGLGYDLYSADAAPLKSAMAAGGGSYIRAFRHMDGERRIVLTAADCTLTSIAGGQEFTELCRDGKRSFTNRYGLSPATGKIVASRQWIGWDAGYMGLNQTPNP